MIIIFCCLYLHGTQLGEIHRFLQELHLDDWFVDYLRLSIGDNTVESRENTQYKGRQDKRLYQMVYQFDIFCTYRTQSMIRSHLLISQLKVIFHMTKKKVPCHQKLRNEAKTETSFSAVTTQWERCDHQPRGSSATQWSKCNYSNTLELAPS